MRHETLAMAQLVRGQEAGGFLLDEGVTVCMRGFESLFISTSLALGVTLSGHDARSLLLRSRVQFHSSLD